MVSLVSGIPFMPGSTIPVSAAGWGFPPVLVQIHISPISSIILVSGPLPPMLLCVTTLVPRPLGS